MSWTYHQGIPGTITTEKKRTRSRKTIQMRKNSKKVPPAYKYATLVHTALITHLTASQTNFCHIGSRRLVSFALTNPWHEGKWQGQERYALDKIWYRQEQKHGGTPGELRIPTLNGASDALGVQDRPGMYNLEIVLRMSTRRTIIFWVWTATSQRYEGGKIYGKAQKRTRLHGPGFRPFGRLSLLSFNFLGWCIFPVSSKLVLLSFHLPPSPVF